LQREQNGICFINVRVCVFIPLPGNISVVLVGCTAAHATCRATENRRGRSPYEQHATSATLTHSVGQTAYVVLASIDYSRRRQQQQQQSIRLMCLVIVLVGATTYHIGDITCIYHLRSADCSCYFGADQCRTGYLLWTIGGTTY